MHIRFLIFNFVLLCFTNLIYGNSQKDSLEIVRIETELAEAPDTQKIRLLDKYSWYLRARNNDLAKKLAIEGMELSAQLGDSTRYYLISQNLGVLYAFESKFTKPLELFDAAIAYFLQENDKAALIKVLTSKAAVLAFKGDYELAEENYETLGQYLDKDKPNPDYLNFLLERGLNFFYWKKYAQAKQLFIKARPISHHLKAIRTTGNLLLNLGAIEADLGRHAIALNYYFEAIETGGRSFFLSKVYNNIGIIYQNITDYDKSIEYYDKALVLKRELGFPHGIALLLNNKASVHKQMKDYGTALKLYQESLRIKLNLEGSNNGLAQVYNNIGISNLELGDYPKAEEAFQHALTASIEGKDQYSKGEALNNAADTFLKQAQFNKAIKYAKQSLAIAKEIGDFGTTKHSSKILSESYEGLGRFELSHRFLKEYLTAKDSLTIRSNSQEIKRIENQHLQEQQEKELEMQQNIVANLKEKEQLNQQRNIFFIMGLLALGAMGILMFIIQKQRLKKITKEKELSIAKSETAELKIKLLEKELIKNQGELDNYLKSFLDKTELLENINQKLVIEVGDHQITTLENLSTSLRENLISDNNYDTFQYYFSLVHKDFFKNLVKEYGALSPQELNLCALIKINMVNKDIAKIFGISTDSVKKAKQRLYKKLNLADNNALRIALMKL